MGQSCRRCGQGHRTGHFGIELGFEFKLEQGTLVAMLVRGSATANVTVTLQWDKNQARVKVR